VIWLAVLTEVVLLNYANVGLIRAMCAYAETTSGSFVETWTSARRPFPLSLIATGSPVRRFRPHPEDVPMSRSFPSAMDATGTQ
jgi:hypothetical protein